jgi:hypothetical protein
MQNVAMLSAIHSKTGENLEALLAATYVHDGSPQRFMIRAQLSIAFSKTAAESTSAAQAGKSAVLDDISFIKLSGIILSPKLHAFRAIVCSNTPPHQYCFEYITMKIPEKETFLSRTGIRQFNRTGRSRHFVRAQRL